MSVYIHLKMFLAQLFYKTAGQLRLGFFAAVRNFPRGLIVYKIFANSVL